MSLTAIPKPKEKWERRESFQIGSKSVRRSGWSLRSTLTRPSQGTPSSGAASPTMMLQRATFVVYLTSS